MRPVSCMFLLTLMLRAFLQPLPAGQKRKREDWEMIWYVGMYGSLAVGAVLLYYKPDTRYVDLPVCIHRLMQNNFFAVSKHGR